MRRRTAQVIETTYEGLEGDVGPLLARQEGAPWRRPSPTGLCSPWPHCWSSGWRWQAPSSGRTRPRASWHSTPAASSDPISPQAVEELVITASDSQVGRMDRSRCLHLGRERIVRGSPGRPAGDLRHRLRANAGVLECRYSSTGDGCRRGGQRLHAGDTVAGATAAAWLRAEWGVSCPRPSTSRPPMTSAISTTCRTLPGRRRRGRAEHLVRLRRTERVSGDPSLVNGVRLDDLITEIVAEVLVISL